MATPEQKEKKRIADAARYERNKEQIKEQARVRANAYYHANKADPAFQAKKQARGAAWRASDDGRAYNKKYAQDNRQHLYELHKKFRTTNKKHYARIQWESHIRCKYGLTSEDVARMLYAQDRKCAIGGEAFSEDEEFCIDHDHKIRKVRAILCHRHNLAIGKFKENNQEMLSAQEYLKKHG